MCAQGIKWNTQEKLAIGANTDADTVIAGYANETILGIKTETLVGGWGVGVGGLKVEVIVGAQIGWVEGYKYDRIPFGQVEVVGDHVGSHGSHTTSVGTSFFVNAETSAKIQSQNLILTANQDIPEVLGVTGQAGRGPIVVHGILQPAVQAVQQVIAVPATSNTSTLSLTPTQAALIGCKNPTTNLTPASLFLTQTGATLTGITATNLVSILASALIINHATSVSLGTPDNNLTANDLGVTIVGAPAVILNTDNFKCNSAMTAIGQPAVVAPTYADLLAAAQLAASDAAAAAVAALAASYP